MAVARNQRQGDDVAFIRVDPLAAACNCPNPESCACGADVNRPARQSWGKRW